MARAGSDQPAMGEERRDEQRRERRARERGEHAVEVAGAGRAADDRERRRHGDGDGAAAQPETGPRGGTEVFDHVSPPERRRRITTHQMAIAISRQIGMAHERIEPARNEAVTSMRAPRSGLDRRLVGVGLEPAVEGDEEGDEERERAGHPHHAGGRAAGRSGAHPEGPVGGQIRAVERRAGEREHDREDPAGHQRRRRTRERGADSRSRAHRRRVEQRRPRRRAPATRKQTCSATWIHSLRTAAS